jgi:hypothetical protein
VKNKSYVEMVEFRAVVEAIRNFLAVPVHTVKRSTCVREDVEARRTLAAKQLSMYFVQGALKTRNDVNCWI